LRAYSTIHRFFRVQGYKIKNPPDNELIQFMNILDALNIDYEMKEPENFYVRTHRNGDSSFWERDLCILTFKKMVINACKITEHGCTQIIEITHSHSDSKQSSHKEIRYFPQYHMKIVLEEKGIPQLEAYGTPIKKRKG